MVADVSVLALIFSILKIIFFSNCFSIALFLDGDCCISIVGVAYLLTNNNFLEVLDLDFIFSALIFFD